MKYFTGEEIKKGDFVYIENGKTAGIVYDIIENKEQMEFWGVCELGVMIKSKPFGLVLWTIEEKHDSVIFVKRGSPGVEV